MIALVSVIRERAGFGRTALIDELAHPTVELAGRVGIMPLDRPGEIGHFIRVVGERIISGSVFEQEFRFVERDMLQCDVVLDLEPPGLPGKVGDGDAIVEDVVNPAKPVRTRLDRRGWP